MGLSGLCIAATIAVESPYPALWQERTWNGKRVCRPSHFHSILGTLKLDFNRK